MGATLQKQIKRMEKEQQRYQQLVKLQQSSCPHVKKSGKSRLEKFNDGEIEKARCSKCRDEVIIDRELLAPEQLQLSVDVVKTALAEIRALIHMGKIELDPKTLNTMIQFDAEVLRDLPDVMSKMMRKRDKKKSGKGKKKIKNQRKRWQ